MRSKTEPSGQTRPTFIEEARRSQIIETAIEIIATRGVAQASLALIARQAGCSKGVISYHFEGKEELIDAILSRIIRAPTDFIKSRVEVQARAMDKLRAFVSASFEFMAGHRNHYIALVDLWGSRGWYEGRNRFNAEVFEPTRHYLARILEAGREAGELEPRPATTMASILQASIDGVMVQWVCDPEAVDLQASTDEILKMAEAHLRAGN
ncbi:MAG: TetR/AcrR family transcriptional regulator [bacterium]|nr:TetR/AcrR family transcriptional regulator [bacterium]